MKRIHLVVLTALTFVGAGAVLTASAATDAANRTAKSPALKDTLIDLEQQSWVAWKARDATFFEGFLSDDHVEVGPRGAIGKAAVVAGVGSPACTVDSYTVGNFQFTQIAADVAVLNYRAEQATVCGGFVVPSPAWATSVYVKRHGRWLNVVYQQTPIPG